MTELFAKLESWDYMAAFILLFSLWLLLGGTKKLYEADPERVDPRKIKIRAYGGAIAAVAYLICRYVVM